MSSRRRRLELAALFAAASLATLGIGAGTAAAKKTPPPPSQPKAPAGAPAVTFSPTSLTFGPQDLTTTSGGQTITVTNSGNAPLFFNSAVTRGTDPLDFTQIDDQCSGVTLAAGSSCSVTIDFHPILGGTRSASFIVTDNAANSPQSVPITGTGVVPAGTEAPPLQMDTQFDSCSGTVCAVDPDANLLANNFFAWGFAAKGGTEPYTFSGSPPAGFTLRPSGLLFGTKTTVGTVTFPVTVTDGAGSQATQTFSITTHSLPAPTPKGCQTGGTVKEPLSGSAIGGKAPSGQAQADESQFSGCGGFVKLTVSVTNVNLPNGTTLWVTLDFGAVGKITLSGGRGSMSTFVLQHALSFDHIAIYDRIPDTGGANQILTGGFFS